MPFNWLDFVLIGLLGISGLVGLTRGLVKEVLSLVTWGVAIWVGIQFSGELAPFLGSAIPSPTLRLALAFSILFIASFLVATLVGILLTRILETTGLSGIDRLAGLVFGLARGALILSVMVFLSRSTPFPKEPVWQSSKLIPIFQATAVWLEGQIPPGLMPKLNVGSSSH
jgi:membrane protein required for colicin V production